MNKGQAITKASEQVSNLYQMGEHWHFKHYDEFSDEWIESRSSFHKLAFSDRACCLIEKAKKSMGCRDRGQVSFNGGEWTDYL